MDFAKLFSLEGRVALITGGSRGIGEMLLEGYLAAGCERVYITARKAQQLEETAAKYGDKVVGLPGDISRMEGIEELAAELGRRESRLDILVNNAGAAWGEPFEEFSQRQVAVFPDPEASPAAQGRGEPGTPGQGDQHRLDRRPPAQSLGNLSLSGVEGGGDPSDQADGGPADHRQHRRQLHRPGRLSQRDEQVGGAHS